jgi:hypothetical protein
VVPIFWVTPWLRHRGNDLIQYPHCQQGRILRSTQSKAPSVSPPVSPGKKGTVRFVRGADRETLANWRKSNDKRVWQKAVAILENWSLSLEEIARKIEKSPSQIRCWIKAYNRQGLEGLIRKTRGTSNWRATKVELTVVPASANARCTLTTFPSNSTSMCANRVLRLSSRNRGSRREGVRCNEDCDPSCEVEEWRHAFVCQACR